MREREDRSAPQKAHNSVSSFAPSLSVPPPLVSLIDVAVCTQSRRMQLHIDTDTHRSHRSQRERESERARAEEGHPLQRSPSLCLS